LEVNLSNIFFFPAFSLSPLLSSKTPRGGHAREA
jgi:hypothetical protein